MSDAYIIELHGQAVGLIVRERDSYRFFASLPAFWGMEGKTFKGPIAAERAARDVLRKKPQALPGAAHRPL